MDKKLFAITVLVDGQVQHLCSRVFKKESKAQNYLDKMVGCAESDGQKSCQVTYTVIQPIQEKQLEFNF